MKKQNQKGFTLAELLIVVAIIAVLVAIAIPVFTKRLEASRETTDLANLRAAYAAGQVAALAGELTNSGGYYFKPDAADGLILTSSGAPKLGRGTVVDGGTDLGSKPSVCKYGTKSGVQNKPIKITVQSGNVHEVFFDTSVT